MAKPDQTVCCIAESQEVRDTLGVLCASIALKSEGYKSIGDYLGRLSSHRPRCVILEIPPGNGVRALNFMAIGDRHTPIIAILDPGQQSLEFQDEYQGLFLEIIHKPFLPQQLLDAIGRALRSWVSSGIR